MNRFLITFAAVSTFAFAASAQPDKPAARKSTFPALPEADAWGKLPPQKNPSLPEWARVLARPLPKTIAKMLELDYFHRAKNPLGLVLAARIRGEVASTLRSKYGSATAEADHRRELSPEVRFGPAARKTPTDLMILAFAKKLTEQGHAITDKEFAELLDCCGPEKVTAIVHTVAYANFHNRIVLALGVKGEDLVAEPVAMQFDLDAAKIKAPDRPPWDDLKNVKGDGISIRVEWSKKEYDQLNATLAKQKERKLRMPLPDKSVYEKLTVREQDSANKILWNTVSMCYQPEMTAREGVGTHSHKGGCHPAVFHSEPVRVLAAAFPTTPSGRARRATSV